MKNEKIKIEIKSIFGKVLFTYECAGNTIAKTVTEAVKSSANLRFADLSSADLSFANLRSADLSSADLRSADLRSANLSYANLSFADLSFADLSSANLRSADLSSADLRYANLSYANLIFADLSSANLSYANLSSADLSFADLSSADLISANLRFADLSSANLRSANLRSIRNDFWDVLLRAPKEIAALKIAIQGGKINGSVYKGECACLVGTIANIRHVDVEHLGTIKPDSDRPIERFFLGLKEGDTPENNPVSKVVLDWLDEFIILTSNAAEPSIDYRITEKATS